MCRAQQHKEGRFNADIQPASQEWSGNVIRQQQRQEWRRNEAFCGTVWVVMGFGLFFMSVPECDCVKMNFMPGDITRTTTRRFDYISGAFPRTRRRLDALQAPCGCRVYVASPSRIAEGKDFQMAVDVALNRSEKILLTGEMFALKTFAIWKNP